MASSRIRIEFLTVRRTIVDLALQPVFDIVQQPANCASRQFDGLRECALLHFRVDRRARKARDVLDGGAAQDSLVEVWRFGAFDRWRDIVHVCVVRKEPLAAA